MAAFNIIRATYMAAFNIIRETYMAAFNIIRATYMQSITLSDLVQVSRFYSSFKYVHKFKFCVSAVVKRYP